MQEKPEIVNNKEEIPWEHYKAQFEKIDPEETASRCHVEYDPSAGGFAIRLMGVEYRVSWPEFEVTTSHEGYAALRDTLQAKILTARFLTEGCYAPSEGKFVTYRDVPWGEHYFKPFQGRCLMRLALSYGTKIEVFRALMEQLGAKALTTGDAGYDFEFINGIHIQFLLWAPDEEFPPSSQILFADNAVAAFTAEDMAVIGDVSINTLKAMEKEAKKGTERTEGKGEKQ